MDGYDLIALAFIVAISNATWYVKLRRAKDRADAQERRLAALENKHGALFDIGGRTVSAVEALLERVKTLEADRGYRSY